MVEYGTRIRLERNCWQEWVLSNSKQNNPGLLDEMNSVAGDETQRRNLPSEASSELQRHQRQNQEHLQEYQKGVQRHLSEVQNEVQSQQVASREEVGKLRQKGHIVRICTLQADLGASESSSEIQQSCDMSVIH